MLHLFDLGGQLRLVDMPGYGTRPPRPSWPEALVSDASKPTASARRGIARDHWSLVCAVCRVCEGGA